MAIDFPIPSQVGQVYTDLTSGNTYVCVVLGPPAEWSGSSSNADLNQTYLRTDAANGPVSGDLFVGGTTTAPGITLSVGGSIAGPNTSSSNKYAIDNTGSISIGGTPTAPNITLIPTGVISAVNTTIQPISSNRRLKENFAKLDPVKAWETIKSLPFYSFSYKSSGEQAFGAVAEEVPSEMRVETGRFDSNGQAIQTYNNGMLQARLFTALQTALSRIESLESEVAILKEA